MASSFSYCMAALRLQLSSPHKKKVLHAAVIPYFSKVNSLRQRFTPSRKPQT